MWCCRLSLKLLTDNIFSEDQPVDLAGPSIPRHRDQHNGGREQRDSERGVGQEFETIKKHLYFSFSFF